MWEGQKANVLIFSILLVKLVKPIKTIKGKGKVRPITGLEGPEEE
jgi:hypothetical protein